MKNLALMVLLALAACQPRYAGSFAGGAAQPMQAPYYPYYPPPPLWQTPNPSDYGLGFKPPSGQTQTCMPSQLGGSMLGGSYCY